ncbi:unnamed protein product [Trichobilharzia regenti]|nr:unnamed protein product [Trichobilharzia regenti]
MRYLDPSILTAVEYFAESSVSAQNEAYQRINSGVYSAELIGDKFYWYKSQLKPVYFNCWDKLLDDTSTMVETPTLRNSTPNPHQCLLLLQAFETAKFTFHRQYSEDVSMENTSTATSTAAATDSSNESSMDYFSGKFNHCTTFSYVVFISSL